MSADAILERLRSLYPVLIDLSLGRLEALLARLGHPERRLPPVIHVAGTNGKGSTTAYLRAIGEAAGRRVHVMTSPHLVSVTERFRVAGTLVSEHQLADTLGEIERVNAGGPITVFEALTAAGLLLFARQAADLAVIEVGLGGRLDATNVVRPAVAAITSISMDHEAFLGETLAAIAGEKAGIIKRGVDVVTGRQAPDVLAVIARAADAMDAPLAARDRDWRIEPEGTGLAFSDGAGRLALPRPGLLGAHQFDNAGIAVAALRRVGLDLPGEAWAAIAAVDWPARLQRLDGTLARTLPEGFELWLDGGHNPAAGAALAGVLADWRGRPLYLVVGMKETKDVRGFLAPLLPLADGIWAVREAGQEFAVGIEAIIAASDGRARPGPSVREALAAIADLPPGRVLVCGSLYLAGEVLRMERSPG